MEGTYADSRKCADAIRRCAGKVAGLRLPAEHRGSVSRTTTDTSFSFHHHLAWVHTFACRHAYACAGEVQGKEEKEEEILLHI
jgi:hypothetical protein